MSSSNPIYNAVRTFTKKNLAKNDMEEETESIARYDWESIDKFHQDAPTVTFLFNHFSLGYDYFSSNADQIMGYSHVDFLKGGLKFAMSLVDSAHAKIYSKHILPLMFKYQTLYALRGKSKDIRFSYTFSIRRKDGVYIWALHHMNVVQTNKLGIPSHTHVCVSDISALKKDNFVDFIVSEKGENGIFVPIFSTLYSENNEKISFTKRELDVLLWVSKGFTSRQIAEKLNLSVHTVNNHKKRMLEKNRGKNTAELVSLAAQKGLILSK
jgi:DNA-binding CsgD family transcriptional regulator